MKQTKKTIEAEKVIDKFILKNGVPPTYEELKDLLKISKTAAFARARVCRHKMKLATGGAEDYVLVYFGHLLKKYPNYKEYKKHLLSGEVKITIPQAIELMSLFKPSK